MCTYAYTPLCTFCLLSVRGNKALVLDKQISGPLGLVAEVDLLKSNGVEQIYHLLPEPLYTEATNIIYVVRPEIQLMKHIAHHIQVFAIYHAYVYGYDNAGYIWDRVFVCVYARLVEGVSG